MSGHVFVDETKRRGYLLVAGVVSAEDLDPLRRSLRGLVLPGQRRQHMNDENDSRRRSIATAIAVSGVQATIYDAGRRYRNERERRRAIAREPSVLCPSTTISSQSGEGTADRAQVRLQAGGFVAYRHDDRDGRPS